MKTLQGKLSAACLRLSLLLSLVLPADAAQAASFASTGTDTSAPVIFVHGFGGTLLDFSMLNTRFLWDGYPAGNLYHFSYNSLLVSNKTSASQLANFVNTVRSKHGNKQVIIIAHSNGALVTRWYRTMLGGTTAMKRFISMGGPHAGTTSAYQCISPACHEMRPDSAFLQELDGRGCNVSFWSATDGTILPAPSAQCGTSIQTKDVSHLGLLWDTSVYEQLRGQL